MVSKWCPWARDKGVWNALKTFYPFNSKQQYPWTAQLEHICMLRIIMQHQAFNRILQKQSQNVDSKIYSTWIQMVVSGRYNVTLRTIFVWEGKKERENLSCKSIEATGTISKCCYLSGIRNLKTNCIKILNFKRCKCIKHVTTSTIFFYKPQG